MEKLVSVSLLFFSVGFLNAVSGLDKSQRARRCDAPIPKEICQGNLVEVRWYFDATSRKCRGYYSKFCNETANSFINRKECIYSCIKPTCYEKPASKGCSGRYVIRWYFDYPTLQCKTFLHNGCSSTENLFDDPVKCYNACVREFRSTT